ncbi:MAG: hypothetical protein B6I37_08200 [Desulfobacteraceae bacterium 4572_35.2]|nr:MAG: hypothetical protein B6I37_08200 [Desulfobacteraceae bacterium 4572_35.2]
MRYNDYPPYVSVAEKRAKAEKKIKQLRKKNPDLRPVILEGRSLARTWWGKSWNKNLERYADYSNRIGRGRSYVRHLAVVDLQIAAGKVTALVQGSQGKPYKVAISIDKMPLHNWHKVKLECQAKLSSLPDLLAGKFPKDLQEMLMLQGDGLFPTPKEINFDCNCPDWADMCKHIAAVLYGVGARLDEEPTLFFTLRQVNVQDLIGRAVHDKTASILKGKSASGSKVIGDDKLADVFGIDMDDFDIAMPIKTKPKMTATTKAQKTIKRKNSCVAKKDTPTPMKKTAATAVVSKNLDNRANGLSIKELHQLTGFSASKLYGILFRLKQQKKVENVRRGVYRLAERR